MLDDVSSGGKEKRSSSSSSSSVYHSGLGSRTGIMGCAESETLATGSLSLVVDARAEDVCIFTRDDGTVDTILISGKILFSRLFDFCLGAFLRGITLYSLSFGKLLDNLCSSKCFDSFVDWNCTWFNLEICKQTNGTDQVTPYHYWQVVNKTKYQNKIGKRIDQGKTSQQTRTSLYFHWIQPCIGWNHTTHFVWWMDRMDAKWSYRSDRQVQHNDEHWKRSRWYHVLGARSICQSTWA